MAFDFKNYEIEGFFEYVVPPLEGFWWQNDVKGVDYSSKEEKVRLFVC